MQHFLQHLGITHSYLFLNTFVYPIFGQYEGDHLLWLGQNPNSPIVKHRHAIFDYALEQHDIRLIVAVGRAAKETVHTWVQSHGGACPLGFHDVERCAASALGPDVRIVGVVHPGAAGQGGSTTAILADFKRALTHIATWTDAEPSWLPVDPGATRGAPASYKYRSAPIPFRDLPYGTSWRVGQGGTSSNRKDGQRGIQMFSEDGDYAANVGYPDNATGTADGYVQDAGDLAYEPPRHRFADFDSGPSPALAQLMMGGAPGLSWPDFSSLGVTAHPSFGYGPIYRGRPPNARVLIFADQESQDDLFTGRAFTGAGGQHFQELLHAMGIDRSYLILRVLPVDTSNLTAAQIDAIIDHSQVRKVHEAIVARVLAEGNVALALTVGRHAKRLAGHVVPSALPSIEFAAWDPDALPNWKKALDVLRATSYTKDLPAATFTYDGRRGQIPRIDLPYGTLRWMGTSGNRAVRARISGTDSPHYYKYLMPMWASRLKAAALSDDEQRALQNAPHAGPSL
jgi:Uracil DNA glycosylase superfamily